MKFVAMFLSVWVLFLSLLPCNDVEDHTHFEGPKIAGEYHMTGDYHSEHGGEVEHCAPFCHCGCCQSAVTIHSFASLLNPVEHGMTRFPLLHDQFEARHPSAVWHPPIA